MAKFRRTDNFGRFQKYATVRLTKELVDMANDIDIDAKAYIKNKLEMTYKKNVLESYSARTVGNAVSNMEAQAFNTEQRKKEMKSGNTKRLSRKKVSYKHTGLFLDSIYTVVEGDAVKIKLKELKYKDKSGKNKYERTTLDIYKYLTEGTAGGGSYPYKTVKHKLANGETVTSTIYAPNYPTPKHEFEEYTSLEMKGILEAYKESIKRDHIQKAKYMRSK